jgi:hypothetical protein
MKKRGIPMEWVRADFEEISVAREINSYAEATL